MSAPVSAYLELGAPVVVVVLDTGVVDVFGFGGPVVLGIGEVGVGLEVVVVVLLHASKSGQMRLPPFTLSGVTQAVVGVEKERQSSALSMQLISK